MYKMEPYKQTRRDPKEYIGILRKMFLVIPFFLFCTTGLLPVILTRWHSYCFSWTISSAGVTLKNQSVRLKTLFRFVPVVMALEDMFSFESWSHENWLRKLTWIVHYDYLCLCTWNNYGNENAAGITRTCFVATISTC